MFIMFGNPLGEVDAATIARAWPDANDCCIAYEDKHRHCLAQTEALLKRAASHPVADGDKIREFAELISGLLREIVQDASIAMPKRAARRLAKAIEQHDVCIYAHEWNSLPFRARRRLLEVAKCRDDIIFDPQHTAFALPFPTSRPECSAMIARAIPESRRGRPSQDGQRSQPPLFLLAGPTFRDANFANLSIRLANPSELVG
jgi:hypothetical protein